MRLFFGLPIDEGVRNRVRIAQDRLRPVAGKVKWVEPANLHLTLRFVGETPDTDAERVAAAAQGVGDGVLPVSLALRGVGAFPTPARPRVVWVGLGRGAEALAGVSRDLNARLQEALGLPPEARPFAPHLTVGRVKEPAPSRALATAIEELRDEDFGEFVAVRFMLYHSTLTPRGPIYRVLREYGA